MPTVANKTNLHDLSEYRMRESTTATVEPTEYNLTHDIREMMQGFLFYLLKLHENELLKLRDLHDIKGNNEVMKVINEQCSTKEDLTMDWQERYIDKLDRDFSEIKSSLRATEERIAGMINQTLGEMRDRDNQRISDMRDIRSFMAEERRWVIAMAITTILGVAAMVITVLVTR